MEKIKKFRDAVLRIVKEHGSQEKAAVAVGVSFATVNRWIKEHHVPTSTPIIDRVFFVAKECGSSRR